jgi:hypothetical protein
MPTPSGRKARTDHDETDINLAEDNHVAGFEPCRVAHGYLPGTTAGSVGKARALSTIRKY